LFVAYHLGGDTEMDAQGRILIPPELRRALGIENQPVKLMFLRGVLQVFSEAMYEQYLRTALAGQPEKVATLRLTRGLK
jgi:DNA-binding transcriptional regulator/RsmH inhibitor MraZ